MWPSITFIILLAGICLNFSVLRAAEDDVGNANDYVDEVLGNFRNEPSMVSKVDPLEIPEVSEKKFKLKGGTVRGLSSLYRHGDCTLQYEDNTVKVECTVAVRDVVAVARYAAKALFFWIKGNVEARLEKIALNLQLSSTKGNVRLDSLKVAELGKYKIKKITGMSGVLNWLLKLIANGIAKKSRGKIIHAIEGPAADALRKELAKIKFPDPSYFKK